MISEALIAKLDAQYVGGRLVAMVDGRKEYLTQAGDDNKVFITELGARLQSEFEATPVKKPKKAKADAAPTDDISVLPDDVQIEL